MGWCPCPDAQGDSANGNLPLTDLDLIQLLDVMAAALTPILMKTAENKAFFSDLDALPPAVPVVVKASVGPESHR